MKIGNTPVIIRFPDSHHHRRPWVSSRVEITGSLQAIISKSETRPSEHIEYHKDGTVWAKGQMCEGVPCGYWEWFRKDGTKMRSGTFENGVQVGNWTTYDRQGEVYKVTIMKPKQ